MDRELARYTIRTVFRHARELQDLLIMLREHISKEEYELLQTGVGSVLATATTEITNKILSATPGLGDEIESAIQKYGRFL